MALVGRGTCLCVLQLPRDNVRGLGAGWTDELVSLGAAWRYCRLARCCWTLRDQVAETPPTNAVALGTRHRSSPPRCEFVLAIPHQCCNSTTLQECTLPSPLAWVCTPKRA